jgi:hypothetical protein
MNDNEVVSDKGRNSDIGEVQAELLPSAKIGSLSSNDRVVKAHRLGKETVSVVQKDSSGKLSISGNSLTIKVLSYISFSNFELTRISFK